MFNLYHTILEQKKCLNDFSNLVANEDIFYMDKDNHINNRFIPR